MLVSHRGLSKVHIVSHRKQIIKMELFHSFIYFTLGYLVHIAMVCVLKHLNFIEFPDALRLLLPSIFTKLKDFSEGALM